MYNVIKRKTEFRAARDRDRRCKTVGSDANPVGVAQGFANIGLLDLGLVFEIGDGAGDFEDASVAAGGEFEVLHGALELGERCAVGCEVAFDVCWGEIGVAGILPICLSLARCVYALGDGGTAVALLALA
jgi:hypothetical protein